MPKCIQTVNPTYINLEFQNLLALNFLLRPPLHKNLFKARISKQFPILSNRVKTRKLKVEVTKKFFGENII